VFEVVNLGNNHPVALKELVQKISLATGIDPRIERLPVQPGDVDITYADIGKAKRMIGYQPQVNLENGLKYFVEWFKKKKAAF
jgi:nucleoside-diphosphate-sugar epimerase